MPDFKPVAAGEPVELSAGDVNAWQETARDYLSRRALAGFGTASADRANAEIRIKNHTGQDVPQYGILSMGAPVYGPSANEDEFKQRAAFQCESPEVGNVVIALEPLANGAIGQALVAGTSIVQIDVSDEDHSYADAEADNVDNLVSGATGPLKILWKETGTGVKWALVRFEPSPATGAILYGKATENWRPAVDSLVLDAVVVNPVAADGTVDTGTTHTVYFPNCTGLSSGGAGFPASDFNANVIEGQVIAYTLSPKVVGFDGSTVAAYICLSPEAFDARIGAIKMAIGNPALYVPGQGWGLMDGTANTADSNIDMWTDHRFPRAGPGTDGGSNTHIHVNTGIGLYTGTENSVGGTSLILQAIGASGAIQHNHEMADTASASNIPAYRELYFYERLDNSA